MIILSVSCGSILFILIIALRRIRLSQNSGYIRTALVSTGDISAGKGILIPTAYPNLLIN